MKIAETVVGIAGAGGLGSNLASSLVRIGFKKLIIADFDLVEESNLNRQYFFQEDIGEYKVDALKKNLLAINRELEIMTFREKVTSSNLHRIFGEVDIMVEAFDHPEDKAMLVNEFLRKYSKPIVAASGIAGYESSNLIKTRKINKNFYIVGDGINSQSVKEDVFLAPRVIIAANHQANMVLRLVMNKEEA